MRKDKNPFDHAIGNIDLSTHEVAIEALTSYLEKLSENLKFLKVYVDGLKIQFNSQKEKKLKY